MAVQHTVRTKDGGFKKVTINRSQAIALHCTECMGYSENPSKCTSKNCALYPFRKKTQLAYKN